MHVLGKKGALFCVTVVAIVFVGIVIAFAETPTPAPTPTSTSATDPTISAIDVTAQDLGVAEPSFWQIWRRKIQRVFTFNKIRRQKLSLELAHLTLLQARNAAVAGDTDKETLLLEQYNTQIASVVTGINEVVASLRGSENAQLDALLDQVATTSILSVQLVDNMKQLKADEKFNKEILKIRLEVLKKIVKVLSHEDNPAKLEEKIAKLTNKLAEKEAKAAAKHLRKLLALEDLDEAADDAQEANEINQQEEDAIENDVDDEEERELDEDAKLDSTTLGEIARALEGDELKHILILEALVARVPDQAKEAIQAAIDKSIERLAQKANTTPDVIERELKENQLDDDADVKAVVAKELETKITNEKAKTKLEKKLEKIISHLAKELKKVKPEEKEKIQKKLEKLNNKVLEDVNKEIKESENKEGEAESSPSPSPMPPSSTSGETKEITIEVENNQLKDASYSVPKNATVSVRFRNRDEGAHTITISGYGVSSGALSKDQESTKQFTANSTGSFTVSCTGCSSGGTLTVQ